VTADERRAAYSQRAREIGGDGCTGVRDWWRHCCDEHDVYYRTGADLEGQPVSRAEADARFRRCIQASTPLGIWHPISWTRWIGVRVLGHPRLLAVTAAVRAFLRRGR
jgi:hypothetical protein